MRLLLSELRPKDREVRRIAGAWWYWDLRHGLEVATDAAMEARIKGARSDRNNQLRKIRRGLGAPGRRTLRQGDVELPGASDQFVSPLWTMLASQDPFEIWVSRVPGFFRGVISDWIRRSPAEEYARDFLIRDALDDLCSADRICILLGVFMCQERCGHTSEARYTLIRLIQDFLEESLRNPLGPHVQLVWKASGRILSGTESKKFLAGYDLGAACEIARFLEALKLRELGPIDFNPSELKKGDLLLPGSVWHAFACGEEPATIGVEIDGKAVRLHALHGDPLRPTTGTGEWQINRMIDALRPLYRPWEQSALDTWPLVMLMSRCRSASPTQRHCA